MKCSNCGCENPDDSRFCKKCGTNFLAVHTDVSAEEKSSGANDLKIAENKGGSAGSESGNNSVIVFLKACAVCILVAGFTGGILLGKAAGESRSFFSDNYGEFDFWVALIVWIVSAAYSSILYAYAEIARAVRAIEAKVM